MMEPAENPSLDMVAAALRADSADIAIYARVLTESLGDSLPPGCVVVDRDQSMSDRMRGRPGTVKKITVRLGEQVMTLGVQRRPFRWPRSAARSAGSSCPGSRSRSTSGRLSSPGPCDRARAEQNAMTADGAAAEPRYRWLAMNHRAGSRPSGNVGGANGARAHRRLCEL